MEIEYEGIKFRFARGLAEAVACSWQWFLQHSKAILQSTVRGVRLTTRPVCLIKHVDSDLVACLEGFGHWYSVSDLVVTEQDERTPYEELILHAEFPGIEFEMPLVFDDWQFEPLFQIENLE